MNKININFVSGELYKIINVESLSLTYLQIKFYFDNLDDKYYKILNNNDVIYTNLYDLDYDIIILNNNLTIIFLNYDKDIINKLNNNPYYLQYTSDELKNNFDIVKIAVSNNGYALQYSSDEIKNNFYIVKIAVSNKGSALQYASNELKNNFDIIKMSVSNYIGVLQYASEVKKQL